MMSFEERGEKVPMKISSAGWLASGKAIIGGWNKLMTYDMNDLGKGALGQLEIASSWVRSIQPVRDETNVLVGTQKGEVLLVSEDLMGLRAPRFSKGGSEVVEILLVQGSQEVVVVFSDGEVCVLDSEALSLRRKGSVGSGRPTCAAITKNSVIVGTREGKIISVDLLEMTEEFRLSLGSSVTSIILSRNKRQIFCVAGKSLIIVDLFGRQVVGSTDCWAEKLGPMLLTSRNRILMAAFVGDESLALICPESMKVEATKARQGMAVTALHAAGPDVIYLASAVQGGGAELSRIEVSKFFPSPIEAKIALAKQAKIDLTQAFESEGADHKNVMIQIHESREKYRKSMRVKLDNANKDIERLKEKMERLKEAERRMIDSGENCVKLCGKEHSVIFEPCLHLAVCDDCARNMVACPVCSSFIQTKTKLFV